MLKVDINLWEGWFKELLTHQRDKETDRKTLVNRLVYSRPKEHRNWSIFHICHPITTIDSSKRSLCHKNSKSVLKVDINLWEGWLKELLTLRADKRTDRQTLVNRLVYWRQKEHRNWNIFHLCHTIATIDSLKRSLCHKNSKYVLKVDIILWEGWLKELLTHQTDKRTDRQTLVYRLVNWRKKEYGNWNIFHIYRTITTIDSLKRSLCHKDSKCVLKVDINWWEEWFKELLTHRTDKETDRQTLVNRLFIWRKKRTQKLKYFPYMSYNCNHR